MEIDDKILGERLAHIRELRGKTQEEAGVALHLTREAISRRENDLSSIKAPEVIKLMKFLRYRPEIFLSERPDWINYFSEGFLPEEDSDEKKQE